MLGICESVAFMTLTVCTCSPQDINTRSLVSQPHHYMYAIGSSHFDGIQNKTRTEPNHLNVSKQAFSFVFQGCLALTANAEAAGDPPLDGLLSHPIMADYRHLQGHAWMSFRLWGIVSGT